jgi:hypothetical protein
VVATLRLDDDAVHLLLFATPRQWPTALSNSTRCGA